MGYKRRARVLFVAGHPRLAAIAAGTAREAAAGWFEAAGCTADQCAGPIAAADLVVTLDTASLAGVATLPAGVQHRHLPMQAPSDDDREAWSGIAHTLRKRIKGMAAGMCMLEAAGDPDEGEP